MTTINPNYVPASFYDSNGQLTVPEDYAKAVSEGVAAKVANMPPTEAKMFLSMLQSSTLSPDELAPDGKLDPAKLNESLARLETASRALISLGSFFMESIDMLARLMVEYAGDQRKQALENRILARNQAQSELMDQAGKLKKAADEMVAGALKNLIVTCVMAAVSVGMSVASAAMAGKGLSTTMGTKGMKEGPALDRLMEIAKGQNALGSSLSGIGNAIGQFGGGLGNYLQTVDQSNSKKLEADAQIDSAEAQYQQNIGDVSKEMQENLNQLMQAIINFIKEMKEAEVNMMQSITRG